jgi:hypothetical protein
MRSEWVKRNKWIFVAGPLALVLFIWIGGEVVMHLWNWLLPALFGVRTIDLWQALGLLVLSRILFGGWGGHGHGHGRPNRFRDDQWKKMTPEERQKFRQQMRSRWCGRGEPGTESGEPERL